mmetsp:Transcript_1806/g.3546  ORF Transcript_1806/g.3546 Transcript_1806/m.3546 type:complete len:254 (+) Transcript_1806:711-1472(+)
MWGVPQKSRLARLPAPETLPLLSLHAGHHPDGRVQGFFGQHAGQQVLTPLPVLRAHVVHGGGGRAVQGFPHHLRPAGVAVAPTPAGLLHHVVPRVPRQHFDDFVVAGVAEPPTVLTVVLRKLLPRPHFPGWGLRQLAKLVAGAARLLLLCPQEVDVRPSHAHLFTATDDDVQVPLRGGAVLTQGPAVPRPLIGRPPEAVHSARLLRPVIEAAGGRQPLIELLHIVKNGHVGRCEQPQDAMEACARRRLCRGHP